MPVSSSRAQLKQRQALRDAGLRPLEIWVPDTAKLGFGAECRRQSLIAAASDAADEDLLAFMDQALVDMDDDDE